MRRGDLHRRSGSWMATIWTVLTVLTVLAVLTACQVEAPQATVRVRLMLQNAPKTKLDPNPPTIPQLQALQVRVARVELHVVDSQGAGDLSLPAGDASYARDAVWFPSAVDQPMAWTGVTGEDGAVDLGTIAVPEGRLNQLRLTVDLADEHSLTVDGQVCPLVLGAVRKVTATERAFNVVEPFRAFDLYRNTHSELLIALDPAASLVQTKGCWGLDPYLRVARFVMDGKALAVH